MEKSNLIDMFGLNGDPSDEDRLEKLFRHLASDDLDMSAAGSGAACLPPMITITACAYGPGVLPASLLGLRSQAHTQALHFINC